MAEIKHLNANTATAAIVEELLASGGVIVDSLLDQELIAAINSDADPPLARELLSYGVHDAIAELGGYLGMLDMQIHGTCWITGVCNHRAAAGRNLHHPSCQRVNSLPRQSIYTYPSNAMGGTLT
jgi:hypothetical protein